MIKKLNLLVLMLLTISINTLYAEERIIIIGERTTNNSIICSMAGGGCREFLDSLNQGVDNSSDFFEGEYEDEENDEEETKEECEANIDELTTSCVLAYRQLTIGGAVVTCGALGRFSPPLGAFCGFEFNELLTMSTAWCKEQGTKKKAEKCT